MKLASDTFGGATGLKGEQKALNSHNKLSKGLRRRKTTLHIDRHHPTYVRLTDGHRPPLQLGCSSQLHTPHCACAGFIARFSSTEHLYFELYITILLRTSILKLKRCKPGLEPMTLCSRGSRSSH